MLRKSRILSRFFKEKRADENYWEGISELYYYPDDDFALIYPGGVETKISPVREVVAINPKRVIDFEKDAQTHYFRYEYVMGKVLYRPYTKSITIWDE